MATPTKASRKTPTGTTSTKKSNAAIKKPIAKSAGASSGGVAAKPIAKQTKIPTAKAAKGGASKTR